jgi:hypothetical protein
VHSAKVYTVVQCSPYNLSDNNIFNSLLNSLLSEDTFVSDNGKLFHKLTALNLQVLKLQVKASFIFVYETIAKVIMVTKFDLVPDINSTLNASLSYPDLATKLADTLAGLCFSVYSID